MSVRELTCENCGAKCRTRFALQKYCEGCQVLRDLNYGLGERACVSCGDKFWPIRNTYKLCSECSLASPGNKALIHECPHCGRPGRRVPGTEKACLRCVSTDKKVRDRYREVLRAYIRGVKESNGRL